jgi:hypothetical protein
LFLIITSEWTEDTFIGLRYTTLRYTTLRYTALRFTDLEGGIEERFGVNVKRLITVRHLEALEMLI